MSMIGRREKMSEMSKSEYEKMMREMDESAEACLKAQREEYPGMPDNVEEVCGLCQDIGIGCDELPCESCYEGWKVKK